MASLRTPVGVSVGVKLKRSCNAGPHDGNICTVTGLHVSPYPGAGPEWPPCDYCDRAPVTVSACRDGAYTSALFCADCAPRVRDGDEAVIARIPRR